MLRQTIESKYRAIGCEAAVPCVWGGGLSRSTVF